MYEKIKNAISNAPEGSRVAEIHLQILKYANELDAGAGLKFCKEVGIPSSYEVEFNKMKNLAKRLIDAGLDREKI